MLYESFGSDSSTIDIAKACLLSQKNLPLTLDEKIEILLSDIIINELNERSYIIPLIVCDFLREDYQYFDDDNSTVENLPLYQAIILIIQGINSQIENKRKKEVFSKFSLTMQEHPKLWERFIEFYNFASRFNHQTYMFWFNNFANSLIKYKKSVGDNHNEV